MGLCMKQNMKIIFVVLMMFAVLVAGGCAKKEDKPAVIVEYSDTLADIFPEMPASWIYNGTAEYSHVMSLSEVYDTKGQKIYRVFGEVEDMSDGEVDADFRFDLSYIVSGDNLEQIREGQMLMDSEYERLTLLKLPLEIQATWTEDVVDSDGRKVRVQSTIENIEDDEDGKTIYTVKYDQVGSDYYELRKFKEQTGLIYFEKIMFYDGDAFELQYSLYKLDTEKTLVAKEDDNDSTVKEAGPDSDATLIELDKLPEQMDKDVASGMIPDDATRETLSKLIYDFNDAWTLFANDKDMGVLDYVTDNGEAYDIIHRFPAGTMTLSFEKIEIQDMKVLEDRANVYVHEIIKKVTDEKTEMLEYHWLYEVKKVDDSWKIHSYVGQEGQ